MTFRKLLPVDRPDISKVDYGFSAICHASAVYENNYSGPSASISKLRNSC